MSINNPIVERRGSKLKSAWFVVFSLGALTLLLQQVSYAGDPFWQYSRAPDPWYATPQEACEDNHLFTSSGYTNPDANEVGPDGTSDPNYRFCFGNQPNSGNRIYLGFIRGYDCTAIPPASYAGLGLVCFDLDSDDPDKDDGGCGAKTNNPCDVGTGNKYRSENDIDNGFLSFTRSYNSRNLVDLGLGKGWRHNHQKRLKVNGSAITQISGAGRGEPWTKVGGTWQGDGDTRILITESVDGFTLTRPNGVVEAYNSDGQLIAVTDPNGHEVSYTYNSDNDLATVTDEYGQSLTFGYTSRRLTSVTDAFGAVYRYEYDANDNLATVVYPDTTPGTTADNPEKVYHYENTSFPNHLTGITDENGERYATFSYQSDGRVITSELATTSNSVGQEKVTISYGQTDTNTVIDAVGNQVDWSFQDVLGARKLTGKIHQSDAKGITQSFDANGNLTSRTDAEGQVITYTYNANNQKTSMTEADGTPQARTTTYEYVSADIDLVTKMISPSIYSSNNKEVVYAYDANLNLTATTVNGFDLQGNAVSRTTSYQYDSFGKLIKIDGPRTDVNDVSTLEHYDCTTGAECGQLSKTTNALGHVITYDSYDAAARLLQMTESNGVVTTYSYHPRGWLLSETQMPPSGVSRTTTYEYDAVGQLIKATMPDGTEQNYIYDSAHYLREIADNLGNRIEYSYDEKGNRTTRLEKDPDGTLIHSTTVAYNARNFSKEINSGGSAMQMAYDSVGNLTSQTDPNTNPSTTHHYDALHRLTSSSDALDNTSSYVYSVADQVVKVTTKNNATTDYEYDDLGNLTKETSADRGVITYTHDGAGNVVTMTDARGVVTTYGYDALNRLISLTYPQASENVTYTYDQGTDCGPALGRLCQVVDAAGTHTYTYDAWGNLLKHTRNTGVTMLETHYAYDSMNRITQLVYPSGLVIDYQRDAIGRVSAVHAPKDSLTEIVVDEFEYRANGQVIKTRLGNDQIVTRHYDALGRLDDQWIDNTQIADYGYDANSNLTSRVDQDQERSFAYDFLDRLETDDRITGLSSANWEFEYDANGNRTETDQSGAISPLIYTPNSNRLATLGGNPVVTDVAGNTTSLPRDGSVLTLAYNQQNHLASVTSAGFTTNYTTNHQRQRLTKSSAGATTHYIYDLNGRLLATADANGVVDEEYIYANEVSFSPIYHRLYEDTEANTVEAAQALEKSEQSIADPVDSQGQCNGYERTESDRNNSSARSFNNGDGGVLLGGTDVFNIPNQNIGWFIPILMWYLDDGPPEIIDLDDEEVEPEPIDQPEIIVTWTPAPVVLEHVVDVATTKRALNNQPDVARHCVQSNENQVQINHIPLNGTKVYVRLWSKDNGVWTYEDFEFETTGSSDPKAYVTRTYLVDDHLSTPRFGYNDEQTLTWRWASDGFGSEAPRDDPDADGIQNNINIRFPGQYYDYESGLHYNWNRYYDPETGRYVTSDPIGLDGGVNTYLFSEANPVIKYDPDGLESVRDQVNRRTKEKLKNRPKTPSNPAPNTPGDGGPIDGKPKGGGSVSADDRSEAIGDMICAGLSSLQIALKANKAKQKITSFAAGLAPCEVGCSAYCVQYQRQVGAPRRWCISDIYSATSKSICPVHIATPLYGSAAYTKTYCQSKRHVGGGMCCP